MCIGTLGSEKVNFIIAHPHFINYFPALQLHFDVMSKFMLSLHVHALHFYASVRVNMHTQVVCNQANRLRCASRS